MADESNVPSTAKSSIEASQELNVLCDAFESAWKDGQPPSISDYLKRTQHASESTVLVELVKLDLYYREQNGETPALADYETQFPQFTAALRELQGQLPTFIIQARQIAHYKLGKHVGRGGFGDVFDATDTKLQRRVAVKTPRERNLDPSHVRMFLREAQSAAQVDHPRVVRVYDQGEVNGRAYIVSEFIDGPTLQKWIKWREVSSRDAARVCLEIAEGLVAAHACKVVHRDLKPGNILMTPDDHPKITDFGLAKRLDGTTTIGGDGAIMGTFAYMSPEQANGKSQGVDARSDVYSLGAILYEMLTNRVLFKGSQLEVQEQIAHREPEAPRSLNQKIPKDLETICLKAIRKLPIERYQTAQEFAEDLQRFLNNEPILARPLSVTQKCVRWFRKHQMVASLVALIAVLASGLVAASLAPVEVQDTASVQRVVMDSEPSGANLVFVPLDPVTGVPDAARKRNVGRSPVDIQLESGDYLVVAYHDPKNFHEVYRHVPSAEERQAAQWAQGRHMMWWDEPDGSVKLWTVKIWNQDEVTKQMAIYDSSSTSYVDPQPVTYGDYKRIHNIEKAVNANCEAVARSPENPLTCTDWHEAMVLLECEGKRLPSVEEIKTSLEFEAQLRGPVPNGVEENKFGLWTFSLASALDERFAGLDEMRILRCVAWLPLEAKLEATYEGPLSVHPNIGFRGVRSRKPQFVE